MTEKPKDRKFILQRDIVIPAGTQFDNFSDEAKRDGEFVGVVGIHKDYTELWPITDMEELLSCDPSLFKEVIE